MNKRTLEMIKEHEGLVLKAYPDVAHGWSVATIGYGHTNAMGDPKVYKGLEITKEEAEDILLSDLEKVQEQIDDLVKVPLNENQNGALLSFTFNLGRGNLSESTLLKKLNKGNYKAAAKEFTKWVYANGKKYPGLVRRRKDEQALFNTPVDEAPDPKTDGSKIGVFGVLAVIAGIIFKMLTGRN